MSKGNILIVQSDVQQLALLKEYFEKGAYRVLTATDGGEALTLARQQMPQSIILDLDAPALNAEALIQEVRALPRTRHIHVTLLAPRSEREDKLLALAAGADEFLTKPVDIEELGLRVRNALRRAMFDNLMNPVTGLPGPRLIEEQLRGILRHQERSEWAILRLSLRGFRPFGDVYGFLAGEEVLRFAAQLFCQSVDQWGAQQDFVGHSGADNFIVITTPDRTETLTEDLRARLNESVKTHYSFREREQGYLLLKDAEGHEQRLPLMALLIHKLTSADGPFSDIRELTQALG